MVKILEEDYRKAIEEWKKQNPDKIYLDIPRFSVIELDGLGKINIGRKVQRVRSIYKAMQNGEHYLSYKDLTEEEINYWTSQGMIWDYNEWVEENYRKAVQLWKKQNPDKNYLDISVFNKLNIELEGIGKIDIGGKIKVVRNIYRAMQNDKHYSTYKDLTEEEINYWNSQGMIWDYDEWVEENYRKALASWKKQNLDKKYLDIPASLVIELEGVGIIPLGKKINKIRGVYKAMQDGSHYSNHKDLTDEEIEYWTSQGMIWDYNEWVEENYRKALELWKKQNPNKKYLDIRSSLVIELEGVGLVPLGQKINKIRGIYKAMQDGKHYGNHKDLTEEEIKHWTSEGMIWDYDQWMEENYRKALELWKKQNPDKKYLDILQSTVIELEGVGIIPLGQKVNKIRGLYKAMQEKRSLYGCRELTEQEIEYWTNQGMIWDYDKWLEGNYRKVAQLWKKQNPDMEYLDVSKSTVIELEGVGLITLGQKIDKIRRVYKAMQNGKHHQTHKDLTQEQIEYWTSQGMIWDYEEYKKNKKDNSSKVKQSSLEKYIEIFNGDKEKAELVVKCLSDLKERRRAKKKGDYSIENILNEFDVDIETLEKYLNRTHVKESTRSNKPLEYQGLSLREFCINNGYNYDVIYCAIKLHKFCENDTLEQLINRSLTAYQKNGQKEPLTWVYEKYGTLVRHILLYLRLDASKILNDMSNYIISLEEAIRHNVFLQTRKTKEQDYLEEVYNYLIEELDSSKTEEEMIQDIILKYQELAQEYRFTTEEHEVVVTSFERYIKTIKEYQKADVGLETNQTKKIEKIRDYGLEPEDIEESFFIPLEFDNKVLLGRKSELYLRRQLLRQYIIDWDFYTEEEKEVIRLRNQFTEEEIKMIESTRKEINEIVKKVR